MFVKLLNENHYVFLYIFVEFLSFPNFYESLFSLWLPSLSLLHCLNNDITSELGMQTSRATRELLEIDSQKDRFEFEFKRTESKRAELD